MKKIILTVLIALMVVFASACTESVNNADAKPESTESVNKADVKSENVEQTTNNQTEANDLKPTEKVADNSDVNSKDDVDEVGDNEPEDKSAPQDNPKTEYRTDYYSEKGKISGATMTIDYKEKWIQVTVYKWGEYNASYDAGSRPSGAANKANHMAPNSFDSEILKGSFEIEWDGDDPTILIYEDGSETPRSVNFEFVYSDN